MKYIKNITFTALFSLLGFSISTGEVVVDSVFGGQYVPGTYVDDSTVNNAVTSFTINAADLTGASFGAAGNDKLVLAISTKWASNSGGAVTSLTYDNQPLFQVIARDSGRAQDEIWYLDNVASDGDIDITFDAVTEGFAIYLFALNGTVAGFQDSGEKAANDTPTPELTSILGDSFVMWLVSDNFGTPVYGGSYDSDSQRFGGRGGAMALWNVEGAAGTFTETVTGGRFDTGQIGAVFEAVPEPNTLILIGAVGSIFLLRRRRS